MPAVSISPPGTTLATRSVGQEGVQPILAGPHASCRVLKNKVSKKTAARTYIHQEGRPLHMEFVAAIV
jgi:hypothetical protein